MAPPHRRDRRAHEPRLNRPWRVTGAAGAHLFTSCATHSTWLVIGKTATVLSVNVILCGGCVQEAKPAPDLRRCRPRGLRAPERCCRPLRSKPSPFRALLSAGSDGHKRLQPTALAPHHRDCSAPGLGSTTARSAHPRLEPVAAVRRTCRRPQSVRPERGPRNARIGRIGSLLRSGTGPHQ